MKKRLPCCDRVVLLFSLLFFSFGTAQTVIFSENMGTPTGTTTITSNTFQNSGAIAFSGTADVRNSGASSGYTDSSGGGNVYFTNTGAADFIISGINTSAYNNLVLKLGHYKSTIAGNNDLVIEVSSDGLTWNTLSYSRSTGSNTANWILVKPAGTIPSAPNLRIRFTNTSTTAQFRIDDVTITGDLITAVKPEPTNFPASYSCGMTTSSTIPISWVDAAGITAPDGYLIKWSSTSYADISDPVDGAPEANGANIQNVSQGVQNFMASSLSADTPYFFKIWPYTNSGSNINYKLAGEPQIMCSTLVAPCNFTEDFENIPTTSTGTYQTRTWAGTGGTWSATSARTDQTLNGKAIATDSNGTLNAPAITTGLGMITFNYARAFTGGGARTIQVYINGIQVGSDITLNPSSDVIQNYSATINIPGNVQIEIKTYGAQIKIDDLQWTCFSGTPTPNINIQGNGITLINNDNTPSAADGTDFGSAIVSGAAVEKTFTLQNSGSGELILENPAVVLTDGTKGFTISAQPALASMTGFSNQSFTIQFNNAVPGTYTETVRIGSNDADSPVYSFDVKAVVLQPVITTDKTELSGFVYPFGQGPSPIQSFTVNGSDLGGPITVTVSSDWEISTNLTYDNSNIAPWTTIELPKSMAAAVTNKTIHVRLKEGLSAGLYSGNLTLTSPHAVTQTVTLNGEVAAGLRNIKVTGNGTTIANGSNIPSGLNNTLFTSQNLGNSQTKTFEIKNLGGEPLTIGTVNILGADASSFSVMNGPAVGTVLNQNQTASFEIKFSPTTIGTKNATVSIANNDPDDNPYFFDIRGGATYCSSGGEIIIARQDFEATSGIPVLNYSLSDFGALAPGPNTGFSTGNSGSNSIPKNNVLYSEGARGYRIQGADPNSEIPSGLSFTFDSVNTSAYTDISLSFKIAGFSLGSTGNGMDHLDDTNSSTTIHADKLDYVLVEISPDGGASWYPQAKIVSDELNLAWSFGSAGTTMGSRVFAADQNLTYFNSNSENRYSAIQITNLPAVTNLKVRISAQNNAINESWILDDVRITSTGLVPKVWDGTSWSPSLPQSSDKALINGGYNTADFGGFTVCQCEIGSTATLVVSPNTAVKISDMMINNGTVIVQPGGNLIQVNETDNNSGTGTFKVEQKIHLSGGRNQYNYIISPVESFNMKEVYKTHVDLSNAPVTAPYVLYHNEGTNTFMNSSGAYIKGRALAVKEPALSFTGSEITAVFEGKPANGQFNYTLINSGTANPQRGYNLIGNPYPSNLDLIKLYQNNSASGNVLPTFYLWDNNANTQTKQSGDSYEGQAYAQFNAATPAGSGTPTKANGDAGTATLKIPTRYVSVGQGFMAKLNTVSSEVIVFSNSTRSSDSAQAFLGKGSPLATSKPVNRYWLNMINPQNRVSNIAIVYSEEGRDDYTIADSPSMGGSDYLYSSVDGEKVSINGKSSFKVTDKVDLGTVHFAEGKYSIALDDAEGIFSDSQFIYLKDRVTGIVTNLSEGSYLFTAAAGGTTGRFQIIYEQQTILVTEGSASDEILIYRDGPDFVVKSSSEKITELEMYDVSGRLIDKLQPHAKVTVIQGNRLAEGMYIIKINQSGKLTTKRVIK